MAKIVWDTIGDRYYENGVDHCVLYPIITTGQNAGTYSTGVPWNGVTKISEKPSGADANKKWADNINYLTIYGAEEFACSIEAYTYPDEWMECDGSAPLKVATGSGANITYTDVPGARVGQQPRRGFGLTYRTKIGNDVAGGDYGYKLHLVYGCRASTSDRGYETINDSPDALTFSWEITTTPIAMPGLKPAALITVDSRDFTGDDITKLQLLESKLYGKEGTGTGNNPMLPMPDVVAGILSGQVTS